MIKRPQAQVDPARPPEVARHEHAWLLHYVDFEDGISVREYRCAHCSAVTFR